MGSLLIETDNKLDIILNFIDPSDHLDHDHIQNYTFLTFVYVLTQEMNVHSSFLINVFNTPSFKGRTDSAKISKPCR